MAGTGRRDGADLGPKRYLEVRYDELVEDSERTLRRVAEFLELPTSTQMLESHLGRTRLTRGLDSKAAWLPPTPGLRDWRTQMSNRDIELFEALAGDLLAELGYERTVERFSPEIAAVASYCERWWDGEMTRRQRATPRQHELARIGSIGRAG
jgi:hypothetical protein